MSSPSSTPSCRLAVRLVRRPFAYCMVKPAPTVSSGIGEKATIGVTATVISSLSMASKAPAKFGE